MTQDQIEQPTEELEAVSAEPETAQDVVEETQPEPETEIASDEAPADQEAPETAPVEQSQELAPEALEAPAPIVQQDEPQTPVTDQATQEAPKVFPKLVCVETFNQFDNEYMPGDEVIPDATWPDGTLERRLQNGFVKFVSA